MIPIEENMVGYLLDAINATEHREMESYLRSNPEARQQLGRLREALEPLSADLDSDEPPAGLWVRTLARVAEHQCRPLPAAPSIPASRRVVPGRASWRRADVLVAASIFLCATLLAGSVANELRARYNIQACQNNLRTLYSALKGFSDHHDGYFPNVATATEPPRNVAGLFIPILYKDGLLSDDVVVSCPAKGRQPAPRVTVEDVAAMAMEDFMRCAPELAGCYAYSLGYRDENGCLCGLRFEPNCGNNAFLPILADRPPETVAAGDPGNSPNHAGKGQNVLYVDGHCQFSVSRKVGVRGHDIFLNEEGRVAPGTNPDDAVLASSASSATER
jgi:prepilin-type processing-associated H-X9-DG protein